MPSTFKTLVAERLAHATVDFDGSPVVFTYDANALTMDWADKLEAAKDADVAAGVLLEVMRGWDVVNDDGSPDPLRAEHLKRMPAWAFRDIQIALISAALPSRAEKNESSQLGSEKPSTQDSEALSNFPNGAETSPSQPSSAVPSQT